LCCRVFGTERLTQIRCKRCDSTLPWKIVAYNADLGGDAASTGTVDAGFGVVYGGPAWIGCLIDPLGAQFGNDINPVTYFVGATGFMAGYSWERAGLVGIYKRLIKEDTKPTNMFGLFVYLNI
jgi:hypothetical protein